MARNLLQETNQVTTYNGDERLLVADDPSGTPADGYTTTDDIRNNIEWQLVTHTWTRTGDHTFTVVSDLTAIYASGVKVRYKDGGSYEYGVIASSSYSAPNTTVTLITNSDYAMAATTITDTYISRHYFPTGWPGWFNYTASLTGFSANPSSVVNRWSVCGRTITVFIRQAVNGTSNSTAFTISAPVAASNITNMSWAGEALGVDNGTVQTAASRITIAAAASSITAYKDYGTGNWTATGDKRLGTARIDYEFG